MLAPSVTFGEPANPAYTDSFTRVGIYGEVGFAYRSSYFVDPFLSLGYGVLASGESTLPDGIWGTGGTLHQSLRAWVITPGITADIWRFRPRLGIGLTVLVQNFKFNGETTSSTQLPLSTEFGLGFNVMESEHLRVDIDTRAIVATGAEVSFMTFGFTGRGDLF